MTVSPLRPFWIEALAWQGSVTPRVIAHVIAFGLFATVVTVAAEVTERMSGLRLGLPVAPHEVAGAALGLLLCCARILATTGGGKHASCGEGSSTSPEML